MRYFMNKLPDYTPGTSVQIDSPKWKEMTEKVVEKILNARPPSFENCDGGLYVGDAGISYMLYYLSQNSELSSKKDDYLKSAMQYAQVSIEYLKRYKTNDPPCSFILGKAGVVALGSLLYQTIGDEQSCEKLCKEYEQLSEYCIPINFFRNGSDELFVGRAGYLCGAVNLQQKLGKKVVGDDVMKRLCSTMVQSGREYSKRCKSKSPLMYHYYNTQYLGAAHGLSSILQMLLSFPHILKTDPAMEEDVHNAVDFLLSLETSTFNYAPSMEEVGQHQERPNCDELVHWCHGSPGIVYLFARAYKVWQDDKYLQACLRCGELTWEKGLLRKGPGICHGVAGNGYVFLLLYRLTNDQKHLHRAVQFAEFLFTSKMEHARTPDSPYSLYEGWAGTACFLADLLQADKAEYPLFNVLF